MNLHRVGCWFLLLGILCSQMALAQGILGPGGSEPSPPAVETPSLWEISDLAVRKEKSRVEPIFGEAFSREIGERYVFLADFEERLAPATPEDWLDPRQSPMPALLLGTPNAFRRPRLNVQFPAFLWVNRLRFTGGEGMVFLVNSAMSYWMAEDFQRASDVFLQFEEAVGKIAPGKEHELDVRVGWLTRGFFYLEMAARGEKLSGQRDLKFVRKDVLTYSDLLGMSRTAFARGLRGSRVPSPSHLGNSQSREQEEAGRDLAALLRTGATPDAATFSKQFYCPFYEEDGEGKWRSCQHADEPRNISPELWLRSVAFMAYWNLTVMQRLHGQWDAAFDAAVRMERLAKELKVPEASLPRPLPDSGVMPNPRADPDEPVRAWPATVADVMATSHLTQAFGMLRQRDPLGVFQFSDKAIRAARSTDLKALGFLMTGVAYYDLNHFAYAKRVFSWCEGVSKSFSEKIPTCLLLGAESAFRESRFEIARRGFQRYLSVSGDKQFSPWALFRTALIDHRKGMVADAGLRYAELARLFPKHEVVRDVEVREFCIQVTSEGLEVETRRKWSERLSPELSKLRDALRLQARTCLLWGDLLTSTDETGKSRKSVAADAGRQVAELAAYRKEFPESPYLPLFEDRLAKLNLAMSVQLVEDNECAELVQAYRQQRTALDTLGGRGQRYLATLGWGPEERRFVMRCAALVNDVSLWAELLKTDARTDGGTLQTLAFRFRRSGKAADAVRLGTTLSREAEAASWSALLRTSEAAGKGFVRETQFWKGFSASILIQYDLVSKRGSGGEFRRAILKGVLTQPETLLLSPLLCSWVVAEASAIGSRAWDAIAQMRPAPFWLDLLDGGNPEGAHSCTAPLAKTLLTVSREVPSDLRDKQLVRPYLEKKGWEQGAEEWLAFAQRLQRRKGRENPEVLAIYRSMAAQAPTPALRNVARAWLEASGY